MEISLRKPKSRMLSDEIRVGLSKRALNLIKEECKATVNETGGMLLGHLRWIEHEPEYEVTHATPPGADSVSGPNAFSRGANFAKVRLDYLSNKFGIQYLGEWHKHGVSGVPKASSRDCSTMRAIVCKSTCDIEFPILAIANEDGSCMAIYAADSRKINLICEQGVNKDGEFLA